MSIKAGTLLTSELVHTNWNLYSSLIDGLGHCLETTLKKDSVILT